jgi:hypothetical protein
LLVVVGEDRLEGVLKVSRSMKSIVLCTKILL